MIVLFSILIKIVLFFDIVVLLSDFKFLFSCTSVIFLMVFHLFKLVKYSVISIIYGMN